MRDDSPLSVSPTPQVHTEPSIDVLQGLDVAETTSEEPTASKLTANEKSIAAFGQAIGTGVLLGTATALVNTGPASVVLSYSIIGMLVFVVTANLGEMATWMPTAGGFGVYADRCVNPALGFATGWCYWISKVIMVANHLTAAAMVMQYWVSREQVNPGIWISIFLIAIVAINVAGQKHFSEIELWVSTSKIVVMLGIVILSLVIALGGADGDRRGFRYWNAPGAFVGAGAWGRLASVWQAMTSAVFAFLGTEMVGVTIEKTQDPRRNAPHLMKHNFWRIAVFYIASLVLVTMCIPYNSPGLHTKTGSSVSPFVAAIQEAGINVLPGIINACILLFVLSAANTDLHKAARSLQTMSVEGNAKRYFAKVTIRGLPRRALGLSATICCLAYINVSVASETVFRYFVNLVSIFGLIHWMSILLSHIYFVRGGRAQAVPENSDQRRYKSPCGLWGSYVSLGFCVLISLTKNMNVFANGGFDYKTFITAYLGIPVFFFLMLLYKHVKKTKTLELPKV